MKATCHIIFSVIFRVIPKISLQNFIETCGNFLKKYRQILKMCLSPPKKLKPKLKIVPGKGQCLDKAF